MRLAWIWSVLLTVVLSVPAAAQDIPHYGEAKAAASAGRVDEALALYQKGAEACRQAGDPLGEALCHYEMGALYYDRQELTRALEFLDRALPVFEKHQVAMAVEMILYRSGLARAALEQYPEAVRDLSRALESARGRQESTRERQIMVQLGRVRWEAGDYPEALHTSEEAARLCAAAGDPVGQAEALRWAGYSNWNLGLPDEAERCLRKAADLLTGAGQAEAARELVAEADRYPREMAEAIRLLEEKLAAGGQPHERGVWFYRAGTAYLYLKKPAEAERCFRQAADMFLQAGSVREAALARASLGKAALEQGRPQPAAEALEAALAVLPPG
ncbi:MAG: tetratricopeptide repeat protein, partial [Candidatus Eremiobacterota bacterium]